MNHVVHSIIEIVLALSSYSLTIILIHTPTRPKRIVFLLTLNYKSWGI